MKLERIRTGLLGYGLSGSVFHAPLLSVLDEFDIKKVMTSRKEQVNREIPEAETVSSIEDITSDPEIDLAIVTTPSLLFILKYLKNAFSPESTSSWKNR